MLFAQNFDIMRYVLIRSNKNYQKNKAANKGVESIHWSSKLLTDYGVNNKAALCGMWERAH